MAATTSAECKAQAKAAREKALAETNPVKKEAWLRLGDDWAYLARLLEDDENRK
jgi:hypothetical protein